MTETLLQVPGEMTKVETMSNRSLRVRLDTQENLSDEQMSKIMAMTGKTGWMTFSPSRVSPEDVLSLPEIRPERGEKTPSQRLRGVMYVLWEKDRSTPTFEEFYRSQMEKIISRLKEMLD